MIAKQTYLEIQKPKISEKEEKSPQRNNSQLEIRKLTKPTIDFTSNGDVNQNQSSTLSPVVRNTHHSQEDFEVLKVNR